MQLLQERARSQLKSKVRNSILRRRMDALCTATQIKVSRGRVKKFGRQGMEEGARKQNKATLKGGG